MRRTNPITFRIKVNRSKEQTRFDIQSFSSEGDGCWEDIYLVKGTLFYNPLERREEFKEFHDKDILEVTIIAWEEVDTRPWGSWFLPRGYEVKDIKVIYTEHGDYLFNIEKDGLGIVNSENVIEDNLSYSFNSINSLGVEGLSFRKE